MPVVGWPRPVAALTNPGFRLLLVGQAVALQGTWVQGTAQRWLVLEITDSPWMVGVLGAVATLPVLLFAFWGGWIADRVPRISVLLGAQGVVLFQALIFGWLIQHNIITIPEILLLAFLLGSGMAFEVPARQSLVFDLTGKNHITNALALHSMAFNLARFSGPALAGVLMAAGRLDACFYFKAFTALFILSVLFMLQNRENRTVGDRKESPGKGPGMLPSIRIIFRFAKENAVVGTILLIILAFGILLLPYTVLIPSMGRDILGLGAREYGFLCASNGFGALAGAVFVATFGHRGKREKWWWAGAFAFPLTLLSLSVAINYYQALFILCVSGFAMVLASTSAISLLQLEAKDSNRGQIMGLFTTSFMGLFPLGSLLQGGLAQGIGVRFTLFLTALLALIIVSAVWRRKIRIKPVEAHP